MCHGSCMGCGLTAPCWSALAHRRSPIPGSPRAWRHSHHGRSTRDRRHAQERSVAERLGAHRCRSVPLGFPTGRQGLTHSDRHTRRAADGIASLAPDDNRSPGCRIQDFAASQADYQRARTRNRPARAASFESEPDFVKTHRVALMARDSAMKCGTQSGPFSQIRPRRPCSGVRG